MALVLDDGRTADLTPAQLADEVQVHRNTIYDWIKEERIRAYRIGRAVRIPRAELYRIRAGVAQELCCSALRW